MVLVQAEVIALQAGMQWYDYIALGALIILLLAFAAWIFSEDQ